VAETKRRRPWLAAALALLSPGLGHIYLREWLRAVVWFGLMFAATTMLVPVSPEPAELTVSSILSSSMAAAEKVPLRSRSRAVCDHITLDDRRLLDRHAGNQEAATDEGVSCPHCGRGVDEDPAFCHWCTTRLEPQE